MHRMSETPASALVFQGQSFSQLHDLLPALGLHWREGKRLLFSGGLRTFLQTVDPARVPACAAAEKAFQADPAAENRLYLRWLCRCPGIRALYWQGRSFGGLQDLAQGLARGDETLQKLLLHLTRQQDLSIFLKNLGCSDALQEQLRFLERAYNRTDTRFHRPNVLPMLQFLLSGEKTFLFAGQPCRTPADLAALLQPEADTSKRALSRAAQPLFQDDHNLDPRFEAWLLQQGFQHELTLWAGRFQLDPSLTSEPEDPFPNEDPALLWLGASDPAEPNHAPTAKPSGEDKEESPPPGLEQTFLQLLTQYPQQLDDPTAFVGLMNDFFPAWPLQNYLLTTLYRMDIVKALREAPEITEVQVARFEKRMMQDFGVREASARWAVSAWCRCYGEQVLGKKAPGMAE